MMDSYYPKILIIGETFHRSSGGGITLSNLFKKWPKDRLGNAIDYKSCIIEKEYEEVFTIQLFHYKRIFGFINFDRIGKFRKIKTQQNSIKETSLIGGNLRHHAKKLFFKVLDKTNMKHFIYSYKITDDLIACINTFDPDYIYTQLSNRELISLVNRICDVTKIPLCIHIMDDWPMTIASHGLAKKFWTKVIDSEFRNLLQKTAIRLSISEAMSKAYFKRYKSEFIPFHNPISLDIWENRLTPTMSPINKEKIKVLHAGRIGRGIKTSVIDVAKVIQSLVGDGYNIKFTIQSSEIDEDFFKKISKYNCVKINPSATYDKIPSILQSADILILCNDFDRKGKEFLKYSMPTKASEYMISKVPILVFSDKSSAVYKHASENSWAYVIGENNRDKLKVGLIALIEDEKLRNKIAHNAYNYAKDNYDENIILTKFHKVFLNHV